MLVFSVEAESLPRQSWKFRGRPASKALPETTGRALFLGTAIWENGNGTETFPLRPRPSETEKERQGMRP